MTEDEFRKGRPPLQADEHADAMARPEPRTNAEREAEYQEVFGERQRQAQEAGRRVHAGQPAQPFTVELSDEQVRGYAASALANPVLMGLLVSLRAESMRTLLRESDPAVTGKARGTHAAAEKIQQRLQQFVEYTTSKVQS